jgi:hypothetical protein
MPVISDPYLRGLVAWIGFKQEAVEYARAGRGAGHTHFPFFSKNPWITFFSGVTSFSFTPIAAIGLLGIAGFVLAGANSFRVSEGNESLNSAHRQNHALATGQWPLMSLACCTLACTFRGLKTLCSLSQIQIAYDDRRSGALSRCKALCRQRSWF